LLMAAEAEAKLGDEESDDQAAATLLVDRQKMRTTITCDITSGTTHSRRIATQMSKFLE